MAWGAHTYGLRKHPDSRYNNVMLLLNWDSFLPYPEHRYDTDNFQLYEPERVTFVNNTSASLEAIPTAPVWEGLPLWVKEERFRKFGMTQPYTHQSGKLFSKQAFRPPFILHSRVGIPKWDGINPSLWLRNDLQGKTRELDLFEIINNKVLFSAHQGDHNYTNMKSSRSGFSLNHISRDNDVCIEVQRDVAYWFFNGVHVHTVKGDWNVPFHIVATVGVTKEDALEKFPIGVKMNIYHLSLSQ